MQRIFHFAILLVFVGLTVARSVVHVEEIQIFINKTCPDIWSTFPFDYSTYDNDTEFFAREHSSEKSQVSTNEALQFRDALKKKLNAQKTIFQKLISGSPKTTRVELDKLKVLVKHWLRMMELMLLETDFYRFKLYKRYKTTIPNWPFIFDNYEMNLVIDSITKEYIDGMKFYYKHFVQMQPITLTST